MYELSPHSAERQILELHIPLHDWLENTVTNTKFHRQLERKGKAEKDHRHRPDADIEVGCEEVQERVPAGHTEGGARTNESGLGGSGNDKGVERGHRCRKVVVATVSAHQLF